MTVANANQFCLSEQGYNDMSYTAKALYRVNEWRDQEGRSAIGIFAARVSCQLAYPIVAIAALCETIFRLCQVGYFICFSSLTYSKSTKYLTAESALKASIMSFLANPFSTNLHSITSSGLKNVVGDTVVGQRLKILSHWLDLKGNVPVHGMSADLGGARGSFMLNSISNSLKSFMNCPGFSSLCLSKPQATVLVEAIECISQEKSSESLRSRIRSNKPFICSAGWQRHEVSVAILGDYLAIGNGGPKGDRTDLNYSDIHVYKIDRSKITSAILEEIQSKRHFSEKEGVDFFYRALPSILSKSGKPTKDATCCLFQNFKFQTGENCALYSNLAVLPFLWAHLSSLTPSASQVKQAFLECELFSNWAAVRYAKHYEDGKQFDNRELALRIKKAREGKEEDLSILFALCRWPFLRTAPLISKAFLSDDAALSLPLMGLSVVFNMYRKFPLSLAALAVATGFVARGAFEKRCFIQKCLRFHGRNFWHFPSHEEIVKA